MKPSPPPEPPVMVTLPFCVLVTTVFSATSITSRATGAPRKVTGVVPAEPEAVKHTSKSCVPLGTETPLKVLSVQERVITPGDVPLAGVPKLLSERPVRLRLEIEL